MKERTNHTSLRSRSRRMTREQYRRTLDNMLEGCQIIIYDWRYINLNEAAARYGHSTPEKLTNRTMMEAYPGIETTELFAVLKRCMDERTVRQMENKFENPDGHTGWFELSIQPVPDGLFILSIDITARKLVETQTQKQLARMNALRKIDLAVLSSFDLGLTLTVSVDQVMEQLGVDAASTVVFDDGKTRHVLLAEKKYRLKPDGKHGFRRPESHYKNKHLPEALVGF